MQQQFQCPRCQYPVMHGSQFCNYCGTPFIWQQETTLFPIQQQPPQCDNEQEWRQQFEWNQSPPDYQPQAWEDPNQYQQYYTYDDSNGNPQKKTLFALLVVLLLLIGGVAGVGLTTNGEFSLAPPISQSSNQQIPTISTTPPTYPNPTPIAKPAPKLHDISVTEIENNPAYWNTSWQSRASELQKTTSQINQMYLKTHTYIKGQTDCNDMVVDIWNMLQTVGIVSILAAGNLDLDNYSFAECNHAWLLVYSMEKGDTKPKNFILEATNGQLYFSQDTKVNPQILRYERGFFYTKPSDFRADFKERW